MRLALLVLALFATVPCVRAGEPVVIGAVYNLTGAMASIDAPGLKGMQLAVARLNAEGGVLGRPLRLEVRDCASDPARCREAAGELARLGVVAVAGLNDSDYALAAGEAATRAGVPFVTAGATLPDLPRLLGAGCFMACFGDDAQAKAMAKFLLRRQGVKNVLVLVAPKSVFAVALADDFAKSFRKRGGKVTARLDFDPDHPEALRRAVAALGASGAGVFAAGTPGDAVPMVDALRAAGYAGPVYSGDGFDTPLLAELGDRASPGVFYSTHVSFDNPRPEVRAFVEAWEKAHGSKPSSPFAALGYDAVGLVAQAANRAGSANPARVRQALAAVRDYPGVTGEISFARPLSPPRKPVVIERFAAGAAAFQAQVLP